jgi:lysylphosphatidylglycerol synthetase-like protein (DUF2156 family)
MKITITLDRFALTGVDRRPAGSRSPFWAAIKKEGNQLMALILLVLLLALLLGGLGFAVHILWWIALIVLIVWILGFLVRVGEGGSRSRWYRWLSTGS